MKRLCKCIAGLLILSVTGLYPPKIALCAESGLFAKTDQKQITRHATKIMSTPEKRIPIAATKTAKRKKTPWLLVGLGTAALVGLFAIAAGSGGGGGKPEPHEEGEADVTVNW
jgi:hypothetical protein